MLAFMRFIVKWVNDKMYYNKSSQLKSQALAVNDKSNAVIFTISHGI